MRRKLPYLPFYPNDWLSDTNLSMCSRAARSVWIDMICRMWMADKRGYLVHEGKALTEVQLKKLFGEQDVMSLIQELLDNGVVSKTGDGVLYSRKIVRMEDKRVKMTEIGRLGGNPSLIKHSGEAERRPSRERKPSKKKLAEFVSLTEEERAKLVAEHGEEGTKRIIEILNNYKGSSGKKYKSDYMAILNWVVKRFKEEGGARPESGKYGGVGETLDNG